MNKLVDFLELRKRKGLFGIEIEIENCKLKPNQDINGWDLHHDGSLINGMEFVTNRPNSLETSRELLLNLTNKLVEADTSVRTGVHIHINVQDLSARHLKNFLLLWYIVEKTLVDKAGKGRQGNLFCLRASDAELVVFKIMASLGLGELGHLNDEDIRYCALNLTSLFKFGSLEFRALRTPDNLMDIMPWLHQLERIKKVAQDDLRVLDIIDMCSVNPEGVADMLLVPGFKEYKPKDILEGARIAQMIYYSGDWEFAEEEDEE